jgi:glycosyltransferase involved in cell wall biosynthesis
MTRISIVTPSYNQGEFIEEALESVLLQEHPEVEHLVFDGGSSDNTVPLLQELAQDAKWNHVCWQSGPDGGQSDALNRGFKLATGDIVGWLNSDDRYRPGCFDAIVKAFEDNPDVDVFYGDYAVMDRDGAIQKIRREIEFNRFILLYHRALYIATTATFFRRKIFDDGNLLKEDLHYAMDYEFFLHLAAAGYRIRRIPLVLADFRLHPDSKSCSMEQTQQTEKRCIMQLFSSVNTRFRAPYTRDIAFTILEGVAGALRWTEKLLRGHYFIQYRPNLFEK